MNLTKTMMCSRCHALRWVEDWRENRDEMMSIVLGGTVGLASANFQPRDRARSSCSLGQGSERLARGQSPAPLSTTMPDRSVQAPHQGPHLALA